MTEAELRQRLKRKEVEQFECKERLLSAKDLAEYAVGIGNSGGGLLVMGVTNRMPRKIVGVTVTTEELDRLRESVADSAAIHLSIQVLPTSDGTVLIVRIPPRPRGTVFHTRDGKYLIRLGEQLRGMTLDEIDAARREAGFELSAEPLPGEPSDYLSAAALEELRPLMQEAAAAPDLIGMSDLDLLRSLGVLHPDGRLRIAGLLLAGTATAIRERLPHAQWQFRRMVSDTDYDQAADGYDALPVALRRLRDLVDANNPVTIIPGRLVQPELPRYPSLALRELLVNAIAHRDYATPGAVALKLYRNRLELSNPGGFVGGVSEVNILHRGSAPRYPTLVQALARMRLANAANLGVPRVFRDLLSEGKAPPVYWSSGQSVRVTVLGQEPRPEFLELIERFRGLDVDHLLIVHELTRHREVTAQTAATICQRSRAEAREVLAEMVTRWGLLEAGGGAGRGRYYRLSRGAYEVLADTLAYHIDRRLTIANARARVLDVLNERSLSNADVREITQMDRKQVIRLMESLRSDGLAHVRGRGRLSRWFAGPGEASRGTDESPTT